MIGRIFDIKEFAVHDGPGARTTFFLKGCPLRCRWCHNPEGQSFDRELMIRSALCEGCGLCRRPAENEIFRTYGRNPSACPKGLISLCGEDLTPAQVLEKVLPMKDLLASMEGGVTFSGGEPLLQGQFVSECADLLHEHGVHVAMETCGYASSEVFRQVASRMDYILFDLKIMDPKRHLAATDADNGPILENARWLMENHPAFVFRTPLIPGYTDDEENLAEIKSFVGDAPWEKLPYNNLAGAKYSMLGRTYPLEGQERT